MVVKRITVAAVVGQLGHPRGAAGSVAGWVMVHRRSDRQRNSRVVAPPGVQPTDRVLEIGFGPGLALAGLSRCAAAIAAGRVTLSRASVDKLPPALGGPFDAIVAVNSGPGRSSAGKPAMGCPSRRTRRSLVSSRPGQRQWHHWAGNCSPWHPLGHRDGRQLT
jgi:hypothetical protein